MKKHILKTILMLSLIVSTKFTSGQSITDLDNKNGFKDFKIEDDYSKWQSLVSLQGAWDDGTNAYLYSGTCCNMVFQYPVEKIILRFKDNKIVGIYLTLVKFQNEYAKSGQYTKWRKDDFTIINNSFGALFGKATDERMDDKTAGVITSWFGKKVFLVSAYEFLGTMNGDQQKITILSNDFLNSGLKDGF